MKKRVYAVCSFEGEYLEMIVLDDDEVINEDYTPEEEYGGYPIVTYRDLDGNEDTFHFLDLLVIG